MEAITQKRSKRHRRKRNHISSKDRVSSAWVYAIHAQSVKKKYDEKFKKNEIVPG